MAIVILIVTPILPVVFICFLILQMFVLKLRFDIHVNVASKIFICILRQMYVYRGNLILRLLGSAVMGGLARQLRSGEGRFQADQELPGKPVADN